MDELSENNEKKWRPIGRVLRRVLGVMVEKAKTTPDIYPMTINAIATASNQKSNRHPKMELSPDDVEDALYELREMGAVVEIQGDGRKFKYKHLLYEWLGVDRVELAIMAELLLRGEQTLGELRARASRMEKIEGMAELKPWVAGLMGKGLMIPLTPEGRGQLVTHALYQAEELAKLERLYGGGSAAAVAQSVMNTPSTAPVASSAPATSNHSESPEGENALVAALDDLRASLAALTERVDRIEKDLHG